MAQANRLPAAITRKGFTDSVKLVAPQSQKLRQYIFVLFVVTIFGCNSSKPQQNSFNRYNGSSHIDFLQDLTFLDISKENSKNSNFEITFCIADPFTCTTKFFFISRDNENKWTANSYRYRRCSDTVNIEKVKIILDKKWDSIFALINSETLFEIKTQQYYTKNIRPKTKPVFIGLGGDINYSFLVKSKTISNNIEINRIEPYRDYYLNSEVDISGLNKLIRLKYLFSLVFDFDTDFRFTE